MAVREFWEIKWIEWIAVQENWTTQVSLADTINITWWWTVTDVWWVATINIPYWCIWYREDVTAGSASYTFVHSPATSTSFLVFTDSWTLMFLGIDYTYDTSTETITFLTLWANEAAYIWVAHASVSWWWIWDMVKAVYDPTNINSSAFDYNNFINVPTQLSDFNNDEWFITSADIPAIPTKTSDLQNDSWFITSSDIPAIPTKTSDLQNDSWFITSADIPAIPTKTSELVNDSWFLTSAWDVDWPASSVNGNIVVFDWATGKTIKDSWLKIQTTNDITDIPSWATICDVYFKDGVIYIFTWAVRDNIILES